MVLRSRVLEARCYEPPKHLQADSAQTESQDERQDTSFTISYVAVHILCAKCKAMLLADGVLMWQIARSKH